MRSRAKEPISDRLRGRQMRSRHVAPVPATYERLPSHPAAINHQYFAVDVIACGRGKEDSRSREIGWFAPAASRNAFENLPITRFVLLQSPGVVGAHVTRRDGIDVNSLPGPLVRQGLRQLRDPALRSGVSRYGDPALERKQRSDVDDLAFTLRNHQPSGKLRQTKHRREIYLNHVRPVCF